VVDANGGKCQTITPVQRNKSKINAKLSSLRSQLECWNAGIMGSGAMEVVDLKKKEI